MINNVGFLDYVFPKKCVICKKLGSYICENCFTALSFDAKNLCLICNKPTFNNLTHPICRSKYAIDGCFSALTYNKPTKKLIASFKYKPYLTDLKTILSELFFESLIQNEFFINELKKENWIFVPIPLFPSKLKNRGYNQSEILAEELSKKFEIPVKNLLKRIKDTKTQVGKGNIDRKLNIKGAFEISNTKTNPKNIFLIDDVVTTGSTLIEAANELKRSGAKRVIGLTLARD